MAKNRTVTMSREEISRSEILRMAEEKQITQKTGAKRTGVSERHFRRLLRRYREGGPEGIFSRHRGKASNNRMAEGKRDEILDKLKGDYEGFGPTLAREKLAERDGIIVSKKTVRQIMIASGLHQPKPGRMIGSIRCGNGANIGENWCKLMALITPGWKIVRRKPASCCLLTMPPAKS